MEKENYLTAICFDFQNKAYKYRNIKNNDRQKTAFEKYCASKEIAYINYYGKESRKFLYRVNRLTGGIFKPKTS